MPGYSLYLSQHLHSIWDTHEMLVESMHEFTGSRFPGTMSLVMMLDKGRAAPGWPVERVVATRGGNAEARAGHSDMLRVLISRPDSFMRFPVTGHRAPFRLAQLEVQELKGAWAAPITICAPTPLPSTHLCVGACAPFTLVSPSPWAVSADSSFP